MTYSHIKIDPLTPTIGATVSGIDLNRITDSAVYDEIKQALWQHQVIFFRDQPVEPEAYVALGEIFGAVETHEFFPHVDGFPQIQLISHEGERRPETDRWHTDVTFRAQPSRVSILRAVDLPPAGGDTLWCSTGAAFEALPPPLQSMLLALDAIHDLPYSFRLHDTYDLVAQKRAEAGTGPKTSGIDDEIRMIKENPAVTHPAVINHPVTQRLTLFVNFIWTKRLPGLHPDLSDSLLRMLFDWVKKPEFSCRFRWETDSIAIWDNFATQHYATFDYAPHYRGMQRMTCGIATPELLQQHVPAELWPASRSADST